MPYAPGVSHVPSPKFFALFPVIVHSNSVCVRSILFSMTPKGTTFPTHTIESPAPPPCRKFPTPWDLTSPIKVVSLASPRPTLRAWCFSAQTANHHPFGLGFVPDIGRSVHSPLSCIPTPNLGWTSFTHTLPPWTYPSTGDVSLLVLWHLSDCRCLKSLKSCTCIPH